MLCSTMEGQEYYILSLLTLIGGCQEMDGCRYKWCYAFPPGKTKMGGRYGVIQHHESRFGALPGNLLYYKLDHKAAFV